MAPASEPLGADIVLPMLAPLFARYTLALSKHPAYSTAPINMLQILILIDGIAVRGIEGHGE